MLFRSCRAVSNKEDLILKSLNFKINLHITHMEDIINSNSKYYNVFNNLVTVLFKTLENFSSKQLQSVLQAYPLSSQYTKKEFTKLIVLIESFLQKGINNSVEFHKNMSLVIFMSKCPLTCRYCHNVELLEDNTEKSFEEIKQEIDSSSDFLDAIVISGGEPLS